MKIITVPKNLEALDRLNYDQSKKDDLFEIYLEKDIFCKLFNIGFFDAINTLANVNIDDFEDDSVVGESCLKNVLNSDIFHWQKYDKETFGIIKKIEALFAEALKCNTGVFFYF